MLICLSMDKWAIRGYFYLYVDLVRSLYNIGPCCYVITQVVFWVELPVQRRLCRIFVKSWVLKKWDSMVWCWVTRHPRIFRGLTGCQRTPRIWSITIMVYFSLYLVWFFFVNNFCDSCLSFANSFIKSEE